MKPDRRWRDHYGLHRTGWGDRLVPEAMAHPAKVRPDLAQKIVSHALAEGWWRKGDTLVEPFMGIGGFGLVGGWNGLRVVGVELEAHFVKLAEANIALHGPIWGGNGCVAPVVIHGDSRNLRALVGAAMGSVSSPPYADGCAITGGRRGPEDDKGGLRSYGDAPGNLGNLPCGSVSSPPYADDAPGAGGLNTKPPRPGSADQSGRGKSPSQVGVAGCVSSPPYEGSLKDPGGSRTPNAPEGFKLGTSSPGVSGSVGSPPYANSDNKPTAMGQGKGTRADGDGAGRNKGDYSYGASEGQLGEMVAGSVTSPPWEQTLSTASAEPPASHRAIRLNLPPAHEVARYLRERRESRGLSRKQVDDGLGTTTLYSWYEGRPAGTQIPTPEHWLKLKTILDLDDRFDAGILTTQEVEYTGPLTAKNTGHVRSVEYGEAAGQLGNERGDTFWDALRVIAGELHALLPAVPAEAIEIAQTVDQRNLRAALEERGLSVAIIEREGQRPLLASGVSAWVVKDFVRKGQRVPFCDDCCTLLEQAGFTVFERWRCWMISKATQTDMFTGETKPAREHKGFFRRLAEAKGSPRIDWEEVIWFAKEPAHEVTP